MFPTQNNMQYTSSCDATHNITYYEIGYAVLFKIDWFHVFTYLAWNWYFRAWLHKYFWGVEWYPHFELCGTVHAYAHSLGFIYRKCNGNSTFTCCTSVFIAYFTYQAQMNNEAVFLLRLGLNFKARTRPVWRPFFKMADFSEMGKCVDINCAIVGLWEYIPLKVWLFANIT